MRKLGFLSVLFVALFAQDILAQDAKDITPTLTPSEKTKVGSLVGISSRPVVYGKKNDGLPRRMRVRGVIEEVSFVPFSCGVMCWSGTAKVKLLKKGKGYEPEYAYIAVLCFLGKQEDYLHKLVDVRVSKLREGKVYGCGSIVNSIDSGGVAFYGVDGNKIGIKVLEAKPRNGRLKASTKATHNKALQLTAR
jgi:hypothetical protein